LHSKIKMLFRGICGNISAYGKKQIQKDKKEPPEIHPSGFFIRFIF